MAFKALFQKKALSLYPLREKPQLIHPCINLIKEEHPTAKVNRLEVLETTSCTGLPYSLVLVQNNKDGLEQVIGHTRIVPVKNVKRSVCLEDGVVDRNRRGQGFGRQLIQGTAEFCKSKGFKHMFIGATPKLSRMYVKLYGYRYCDWRIQTIGSGMLGTCIPAYFDLPYPGWECFYRPPLAPPITTVTESASSALIASDICPKPLESHSSSSAGRDVENDKINFSNGMLDIKDYVVPYDPSLRHDGTDASDELPPIWCFEQFERNESTFCWLRKDI